MAATVEDTHTHTHTPLSPPLRTPISNSAATSSARPSSSPLRHRPLHRASTFGDLASHSLGKRRSSAISVSESLEDARNSIRSSTDDLLLPKVTTNGGLGVHHDNSHWHSAPLALALLPAVGGLLFKNGSAIVTDVTLLVLAAVFLNWSVRVPWHWYLSAQQVHVLAPPTPDLLPPDNPPIPEEDEDEVAGESLPAPQVSPNPPTSSSTPPHSASASSLSAASTLRTHELLALFSSLLAPLLGAWLLHSIRSHLSRPSEGLVSDYNLSIFVLAALLRPLSHLIKMMQARTLHLQRTVAHNPHLPAPSVSQSEVSDLGSRLDELEAHIAAQSPIIGTGTNGLDGASTSASAGVQDVYPPTPTLLLQQLRKQLQPDLDALNRAVRRYEKRATLLTLQTESRLQDLDARMADAITLAAAAERKGARGKGSARVLLDWLCAAIVVPVQVGTWILALPVRVGTWLWSWLEWALEGLGFVRVGGTRGEGREKGKGRSRDGEGERERRGKDREREKEGRERIKGIGVVGAAARERRGVKKVM